jgi:hypothetical protein
MPCGRRVGVSLLAPARVPSHSPTSTARRRLAAASGDASRYWGGADGAGGAASGGGAAEPSGGALGGSGGGASGDGGAFGSVIGANAFAAF